MVSEVVYMEILREDDSLFKEWSGVYDALRKLRDGVFRTAEERFETLEKLLTLYSRYYLFLGRLKVHEEREEACIFPKLLEIGRERVVE